MAQKNNRETVAEGLGWELFKNYLTAKEKFCPDLFLYENNKSAAKPIKDQISRELGVELMYINSALVSAQNRQRFYAFNWTVEQPADRGILLRDVLEHGKAWREKAYTLDANYYKTLGRVGFDSQAGRRKMVAEPVCLRQERTDAGKQLRKQYEAGALTHGFNEYRTLQPRPDGKSNTLTTVLKDNLIAAPICVAQRGRYEDTGNRSTKGNGTVSQYYEARTDGKTNTLTTVQKDNCVAQQIRLGNVGNDGRGTRVYSIDGKAVTQTASNGGMGSKTGLYAIPIKFDGDTPISALSCADGKTYPVHEVMDGLITIKGKTYSIKLADGFYIIRKLMPVECERLQTLPDGYTAAVSNAQRFKGLGNGWTAEVIIHILNGALAHVPRNEEIVVLSMYDGIGTGRYCLDKMGFTDVTYYAYEIDKYAMTVAQSNYPDIIQLGDAFDLRNADWRLPEAEALAYTIEAAECIE